MIEELNVQKLKLIVFCLIYTVDWIVSDFLAIRQGSLGRLRYILKNGLKYLPLYGFYFAQVTVLLLLPEIFSTRALYVIPCGAVAP